MEGVMTKQDILKALDELPDDATIEDAMDRLYFLFKLEKSLKQIDDGKTMSQEEAKVRMARWLK
jgi:hypothetical protein